MKKLLLIPAALVLSTGFAFAGGYFVSPSVNQTAHVYQSISGTTWFSHAENKSKIDQAAVVVGPGHVTQKASVDQTIKNTSFDSTAKNSSHIDQAAIILPW